MIKIPFKRDKENERKIEIEKIYLKAANIFLPFLKMRTFLIFVRERILLLYFFQYKRERERKREREKERKREKNREEEREKGDGQRERESVKGIGKQG